MASHFRSWAAYRKAFVLSDKIDEISLSFPSIEKYRLTDQIRRSSSSVCANLGESFGKRRYPKHFVSKITDAASENFETQVWLDKALTRKYITKLQYENLNELSSEVARLLVYMEFNPGHYANKITRE
jgi:four helix bundle protein